MLSFVTGLSPEVLALCVKKSLFFLVVAILYMLAQIYVSPVCKQMQIM